MVADQGNSSIDLDRVTALLQLQQLIEQERRIQSEIARLTQFVDAHIPLETRGPAVDVQRGFS
jgi:hypothetical protein